MATVLDKDLLRETRVKVDDKELLITLTEAQEINLKLKGDKGIGVSINISDLYNQLVGKTKGNLQPAEVKVMKKIKNLSGEPLINLHELRGHNLVTKMDMKVKLTLESVICEMIKQQVKIFEDEK